MTIVEDLVRRARAEPALSELTIRDDEVTPLADYARQNWFRMADYELEQQIRKGQMTFMGIRIRVLK